MSRIAFVQLIDVLSQWFTNTSLLSFSCANSITDDQDLFFHQLIARSGFRSEDIRMKRLNIVAALIAALAIMSASPADAQMEKSKSGKAMQDRSQDAVDRAEMERDDLTRRDMKSRERIEDAMEDESDDIDSDDLDDNVVRDKSVKARDKSAKMKGKSAKGLDNAATRGNEKSQEMRARRDESKMIKEEYKASGKGSEGEIDADNALDADADEASEDGEKKEKKPWWKFWNQ